MAGATSCVCERLLLETEGRHGAARGYRDATRLPPSRDSQHGAARGFYELCELCEPRGEPEDGRYGRQRDRRSGIADSGLCCQSVRIPVQGTEFNGELRHRIYRPGFVKHA